MTDSTELGEVQRVEHLTEQLLVKKYEDALAIEQHRPDEFMPERIVVPNEHVEMLAGTLEELESTTIFGGD